MTERAHALILSGAGRYADPWHPFPETSPRLAELLEAAGFAVEIDEAVDARLGSLGDGPAPAAARPTNGGADPDAADAAPAPDLLVANFGNPGPASDDAERAADALTRAGLLAHLAAGRPLLAVHVASTSLPAVPEWKAILGGIWVRGTTMHPPRGEARIHVYPDRHPIVAGLADFTLHDERYSHMRTADDLVPLADHEHDGLRHPLLWARAYGDARVAYDALGHDADSYDSPEHRTIVTRTARWLAGVDDALLDGTDAVPARAAS